MTLEFSVSWNEKFGRGQAGCISINNLSLVERTNTILDKGTDRKKFIKNFKKKIISSQKKGFYSWVDIGSEYRASELTSALLYSQIKKVKKIQKKREIIWKKYIKNLDRFKTDDFYLIKPIKNCSSAYHLFVMIFNSLKRSNEFKIQCKKME